MGVIIGDYISTTIGIHSHIPSDQGGKLLALVFLLVVVVILLALLIR